MRGGEIRVGSDRLAFGNMKPAPRDAHKATAPAGAVVR
jgi:hypothetical protein